MDTSSIQPVGYALPSAPAVSGSQAAERRQVIQAAKAVNESGILGQNELVFLMDRQTHRPIIRVEDRETHAVVLQVPPEYVLRLAADLDNPANRADSLADT